VEGTCEEQRQKALELDVLRNIPQCSAAIVEISVTFCKIMLYDNLPV